MKIGMTAGVYQKELSAFESQIRELRKIGFDCIDYQGFIDTDTALFEMSKEEFARYLLSQKQCIEALGMSASQTHGPWRWPTVDDTEEGRDERFEKMIKAIRGTALLGCDRMVVHNLMPQKRIDTDPAYVRSVNREFLTRLCAYAKDYGVTVCLENMPFPSQSLARPHQTLELVRELNLDNLRVCLDTGHAAVLGRSPADAVRLIGKDLLWALHVHDTDGLRDRHWLIGDGVIDWKDFGNALSEIGFDGCFSIESVLTKNASPELRHAELTRLYTESKRIMKGI